MIGRSYVMGGKGMDMMEDEEELERMVWELGLGVVVDG